MTMVEYISIGVICSLAGVLLALLTFTRNRSKDDKGEGQQTGVILTELGYIKGSVEGLNTKLDKLEERNVDFVGRLSAVEASAKQAHRRLDHLEGLTDHDHTD